MFWLEPLPGFDEDKFPFVISSGDESLNLINVKDDYHEPLIKAPVWTDGPQQAVLFLLDDENDPKKGFDMHFCSRRTHRKNKYQYEWHKMPFKSDFIDLLTKY